MKYAVVSSFLLWCWRPRVQRNLFTHCYAVLITRGHPYSGWISYIIWRSHLAKTWSSILNTVARTRIKWTFKRILMKEGCFNRKYVNLYSITWIKLRPGQRMRGVWFQVCEENLFCEFEYFRNRIDDGLVKLWQISLRRWAVGSRLFERNGLQGSASLGRITDMFYQNNYSLDIKWIWYQTAPQNCMNVIDICPIHIVYLSGDQRKVYCFFKWNLPTIQQSFVSRKYRSIELHELHLRAFRIYCMFYKSEEIRVCLCVV